MAGPIILIWSDSSEESVGYHVPRVILFGTICTCIPVIPVVLTKVPIIPVDPLVTPEVGAVSVILPTGVLDLVDYSSSFDSDPSEYSLPPALELPLVSPFLCSDDSEVDIESEPAEVASRPSSLSRSSSHDTLAPSSEFPIALLFPHPRVRRVPYRSSDRHSSPDFTSDSSSCGSSSDSSLDTSPGSPSNSLSVTSSVHSSGCDASAHTLADLLPPCKRFRDSYLPEDSIEEHMDISTADAESVADLGIGDEVRAHTKDGIGMGVGIDASDIREDEEEIETAQRQLEADRVDSLCHHMALSQEEFHQIRRDHDDAQRRLQAKMKMMVTKEIAGEMATKTLEEIEEELETEMEEEMEMENPKGMYRGASLSFVESTIPMNFMKCQPLNLKGTEGVVGLIRWFEKMETVFHISNCPEKYQVKYATYTLLNSALTWWNSHKNHWN
ncbi:hypothetical protein Tco_1337088 [Tanacetum coccineum]